MNHAPHSSRRTFVKTMLSTGFALAVQPVTAATIVTDSEGLTAGEIRIPVADGELPGYRACPASGGPFPVVLVVQEIFGVHEHIRDLCRRLAKAGYLAIAPELYARQGDVSRLTDVGAIMAEVVARVPDQQVMADLDAAARFAAGDKGDPARVAVTGFCWGGRITWLYAAHSPGVRAAAAWYGRLTGKPTALQPAHPIDIAGTLKVPVLGLYGGQDQGIPVADVERMRAAVAAAGGRSELIVFPDAPHGFNADYRPSYRADDAREGWRRMLEWFRANGVA